MMEQVSAYVGESEAALRGVFAAAAAAAPAVVFIDEVRDEKEIFALATIEKSQIT